MNRKNLTAAVLAGLAGAAGIAGTAQAVNMNPDGLGQVLIYPYYTSNDGNSTILSVVNTTSDAKAVKVRFLEGYNSREVLDFNLYLSKYDVWVASISDVEGTPTLKTSDTSCTVPYLYGDGLEEYGMAVQPFLPYAYTGSNEDGGPTTIARASEGHLEMIEMGKLVDDDLYRAASKTLPKRVGSATAATHVVGENDEHVPLDCYQLVRNWTEYEAASAKTDPLDGIWAEEALANGACSAAAPNTNLADCLAHSDTRRNTGGLFGGAAVVNVGNGTMFSYDAKAVQGFDKSDDGIHAYPGLIHPSLDDGDQTVANIFFGTPSNKAVKLEYLRGVEAVSAVFMHDNVMNEFSIEAGLGANTDWVMTFPTKSFYVDETIVGTTKVCMPDPTDVEGCEGWQPGDPNPFFPTPIGTTCKLKPEFAGDLQFCDYVIIEYTDVIPPFTDDWDGEACETVFYKDWNREESPTRPGTPGSRPPIVSPAPPGPPPVSGPPPFLLCYETNVMQFGSESVFGTTSDILVTVDGAPESGWANVSLSLLGDNPATAAKEKDFELHQDSRGLVGLPIVGFSATRYVNGFLGGGNVLANYGGIFDHKASVKRIRPSCRYHGTCGGQ